MNKQNNSTLVKLKFVGCVLGILSATMAWSVASGDTIAIENRWLKVAVDSGSGVFQITAKDGGRMVVQQGRLAVGRPPVKISRVTDKTFGDGQCLEYVNARILLFADLPFALIRGAVVNEGREAVVFNKVPLLSCDVLTDRRADALKLLGTGGLAAVGQPVGSYMWLAMADPQTRQGVVGGWLTTDRGSGIVFGSGTNNQARIEARVEYGRLQVAAGKSETLEMFAIGYFNDCRLGLEAYADAIVKNYGIKLPPQPSGHCTWYYARAANERDLPVLAEFAKKELAPFGYDFIQIDDGWQAGMAHGGPAKDFSTHSPNGPYKTGGMQGAAKSLTQNGFISGLWLIPFAGTWDDPSFKDRQHWFAKRASDGKPYTVKWGGTCFDLTHPEAQAYVHGVIHRITHDWGYRYLKLDGLWTGMAVGMLYVNDAYREDGIGSVVFHNPRTTNVEAYRDGLRIVREAAGPQVFVLGCNVAQNMRTYGGSFGLVDAMRVGPDNASEWLLRGEYRLLAGPRTGTRNYFLNRRVWYNDPDPVFVRPSMPLHHAQLICSWVSLSGTLISTSDNLPKLPAERLDLLKRILPAHQATARPVDLFDHEIARIWLVTDQKGGVRRDVIGVFNWDDQPVEFDRPLDDIGLPSGEYVAFDFWGNRFIGPFRSRLKLTVPAQSCVVLAVRPVSQTPQLLSTSRHVTQGMVDVVDEAWDASSRTLTGTSQVVANDPYELRIAIPQGDALTGTTAVVSEADNAAGVRIERRISEAGLLRARITSPVSRTVKWRVEF